MLASTPRSTSTLAERRDRTGVTTDVAPAVLNATAAVVLVVVVALGGGGGASSRETGMIPANVVGKGAPRALLARFAEGESRFECPAGALSACWMAVVSFARRSAIRSPATFFTN